jgi:hypothetical protein
MGKELKNISAENDFDFYYNTGNIPNHDLVSETVEYFETGVRKGFFEPLEFMNLLWKQYNYVNANIQKPHTVITALKALPMTDEQKHVLFGFILKWFGGYPVENMSIQYEATLRLIEKEFLSYPEDTPEKDFCRRDWVNYNFHKLLAASLTDSMNGKGQNAEYEFEKVREHLKTLQTVKEKIEFLTEMQTSFRQDKNSWELPIGTPFDEQCELEIKKLEKLFKLEHGTPAKAKQAFLLANKKGARIDLIRILHAVYELKFFVMSDGQIPSKGLFMKEAGEFFGVDLSSYDTDLSQALNNTSIEANRKIFEQMAGTIEKGHYTSKNEK